MKLCRHVGNSTPSSSSIDGYIYTWRTLLPNFIPIQFEMTEQSRFWRATPSPQQQE